MSVIRLERTIDAGHRIVGHAGKCARLHGHTYLIEVELGSPVQVAPGFVLDFGDVKEVIDRWDHRMLLWDEDPFFQEFGSGWSGHQGVIPDIMAEYGILNIPFNPTAENMAGYLCRTFQSMLRDLAVSEKGNEWLSKMSRAIISKVTVWETPTSCAWAALQGP